jgi:hypothetical protein
VLRGDLGPRTGIALALIGFSMLAVGQGKVTF